MQRHVFLCLTLSLVTRRTASVVQFVLYSCSGTGDNIVPLNRLLMTQQVVAEYKHVPGHYLCVHKHTRNLHTTYIFMGPILCLGKSAYNSIKGIGICLL